MTLEEKYREQHEVGFPIFEKLFNLKKDDFIKVMKDIFHDNKNIIQILENNPSAIKTLRDDEPDVINIYFYDSMEITYSGVRYIPEHGSSTMVLKFDKFFNIDVALDKL